MRAVTSAGAAASVSAAGEPSGTTRGGAPGGARRPGEARVMKYFVEIAGQTLEVDVEARPEGGYRVRCAEGERVVDYFETSPHEASLRIDGLSRTFWYAEARGRTIVHDGRQSLDARAVDERTRRASAILRRAGGAHASTEVRAVMPGIVTRILVREGEAVEAGAPLVCVEAMKMENEVRAPAAGTVKRVLARAGGTVSAGEVLVEIA
jgi:biotin carboxyl carrier protein